jgi:hypothetical protein
MPTDLIAGKTTSTGTTKPLACGEDGVLHVNVVPSGSSDSAYSYSSSSALEASRVVKDSAGVLYGIAGYNSATSAQFIQVHNATAVPADTAVPSFVVRVGPEANFYADFGEDGIPCSTGIVLCNSSTAPTKTIGSSNVFFAATYK